MQRQLLRVGFRAETAAATAATGVFPRGYAPRFQPPSDVGAMMLLQCRSKHTVRIILKDDVLDAKGMPIDPSWSIGDVVHVAAGYARNYLLPQKKAVYATRHAFQQLGRRDPDYETREQKRDRLAREAEMGSDTHLQAYRLLTTYLSNKTLQIYRNVDPFTKAVFPGFVDAKAIRRKLSKQLMIDLEPHPHEMIHLYPHPIPKIDEMTLEALDELLRPLGRKPVPAEAEDGGEIGGDKAHDPSVLEPCKVQIRELGSFVARITLAGGYTVPLKIEILQR